MCPVESCKANISGFVRKNKLMIHLRKQYDNLICLYNYYYAIVLKIEQDIYFRQFYASFKCVLGVCEKGLALCFLGVGF